MKALSRGMHLDDVRRVGHSAKGVLRGVEHCEGEISSHRLEIRTVLLRCPQRAAAGSSE